ncbi:response regulator transcription factor [Arthrobacter sp.]|uniref:helix-turn-helix transcriptional regulator n=1 Tax=Arthrobacter sp. TaxID=1667 RepID=UPI003A94D3AE
MHPYRHALRQDDDAWHVAEDNEWIDGVLRTAAAGNGVVLHGEPGAGQDEFAWNIAHRLAERTGLVELACPPDVATSTTLSTLAATPPAPGRVLFIADLSRFDGPELELVARLVLRHRAIVVAVASDPHGDADAPLTRLLRLEKVRVRDMTADLGMRYLENGLDGQLSERAGYALWENGGGNRSMMRLIAEDWVEAGYLVREDDIWVMRGVTPRTGPRLGGYWRQWLAEQEERIRDVFELLALARELPLVVVLELCGGEAVDAVHDLGYLTLRDSIRRDVSLRGAINVQAIAEQVPPGRSKRLLERVTDFVDGQGISRPPGLVPWRLRCGLPVTSERFIAGAEHLLTTSSPMAALDMLKKVPEEVDPRRIHAVRVGALLAAGEFVDLWTRVGNLRLSAAEDPAVDGNAVVDSVLSDGGETAVVPAAALISASWKGDFRPLLGAEESQPRLVEGTSWLWQQIRHEAMVITGRVQEGLHADREMLQVLEQSGVAPFLVQRGRMGMFDLECLAGEWTRAIATLSGGWNAEVGAPGPGKAGATYNAIAHVLDREYPAAAEILQREIPQLRMLGRHDVLPLAYAVHALSLAGAGRRTEARAALAAVHLPGQGGQGLWRFEWATTFFTAQTWGVLGHADRAVDMLLEFAARDRELGNFSEELLTLSAAVQWGHDESLDLMAQAAERVDGRFAEACTWVVRGLRHGDPEELEYGTLLCRTLGQHFLADYAQRRLESLNGPCPDVVADTEGMRHEVRSGEAIRGDTAAFQGLTPRQRDIVRHVLADRSNADIAREIGLSVRTVESHLYRVYAKLDVANRAGLRAAFGGVEGELHDPAELT